MAMLTGHASSAAGGIAGIGQIPIHALGLSDTTPEEVVKNYQGMAYQPTDPKAIENMQGLSELMQPLISTIDKTRTGEKTFQAGGGPLLSTVNEMAPDLVGAMLSLKGLQKPPQMAPVPGGTLNSSPIPMQMNPRTGGLVGAMSRKGKAASDLANKKPIARAAPFKIAASGAVVADKLAKKAIGAGWDESFITWVKTTDKTARANVREMIKIAKKRVGETKDFSYDGRPSDVLGASLKKRIDLVRQVQRQSGALVEKVAKRQLKGVDVDVSGPLNNFKQKVFDLGGKVDDKGKLQFGVESQLYGQSSKQQAIRTIFEKIDDLGDVSDGYKAHKLKQFVTEFVDYGKASKDGMSANVENMLKGLRSDINGVLKGKSTAYDKVNGSYSAATQSLSDFQKAAGPSIDLFGPNANAATGRVLRKLLSNMQNRENLSTAMKNLEDVAVAHGGKYTDDLTAQAKAVNELERILGSFAETSFKGEITQGVQRVAENPSIRQAGTEAVRMSAKQLMKIRQNQTAQLRALEELIYRSDP